MCGNSLSTLYSAHVNAPAPTPNPNAPRPAVLPANLATPLKMEMDLICTCRGGWKGT